jgi:predicted molibdopterin-dependent oxidoreductase YjgC
VQDIFLTRTAELADVVLPASVSFCETEGTSPTASAACSACRKVKAPPGEARDDMWILADLSRRLGLRPGLADAAIELWNELRSLSPMHRGMSYERLESLGGLQWPCPSEDHPGEMFLHGRLWEEPVAGRRRLSTA